MNREIQERLGKLHSLCLKHRVERLDLFGSATGDDFDPETSDLDFLKDLENLFGRRIDLLEREPIENPYLWRSIERSRKILYEAA
ncbi:MAG TPA: hypothetical protein VKK31_17390 [Thermoanaerobaculia bacterium]|nr:hypothetical protein [Thermoanaerobaculia bacterium]